ncbi:MAG: NAD(P)/FAD-dependent oxidoreductase, partial [Bacillota bacterium]
MFNFNVEKKAQNDVFDKINKWDLLVIGGGPAGLNAGLYAKRKGLEVGIITKEIGGQLHNTTTVDNYLGFNMIEGEKLSDTFLDHINQLDVPILSNTYIKSIEQIKPDFRVVTENGKVLITKTILMATGGMPRKLEIPGEEKLANKGVTYCATCDGPFFKDKHVIVAGGGNSAVEGVLDLVPWAKKITLVHRSEFRADEILLNKLSSIDKLKIYLQTKILAVLGKDKVEGIQVLDKKNNKKNIIDADGLLIEIGTVPNSDLIKDLVKTNN